MQELQVVMYCSDHGSFAAGEAVLCMLEMCLPEADKSVSTLHAMLLLRGAAPHAYCFLERECAEALQVPVQPRSILFTLHLDKVPWTILLAVYDHKISPQGFCDVMLGADFDGQRQTSE